MSEPKYEIGDRVQVIRYDSPANYGAIGTVSYVFSELAVISVDFGELVSVNLHYSDVMKIDE
ncbi:MAG: hypothetical protein RLZZ04_99 [Cyanobacteriota bacterium]|jgi:hypothetical protein